MKKKGLAPKQIIFVQNYLTNGRNASEAMRQAGYKSKNPDVDSAKLLVYPGIQELVKAEESRAQVKFEWTRDQMILTLRNITDDLSSKNCDKIRAIELGFKMLGLDKTDNGRAPYEAAFESAIKALHERRKKEAEAIESDAKGETGILKIDE